MTSDGPHGPLPFLPGPPTPRAHPQARPAGSGWPSLCSRRSARRAALTQVAEDDGQEDQSVQQAQQGEDEAEAEEEDLDELRLGQAQDQDARHVGHGHPGEHLGVMGRCQVGTRQPAQGFEWRSHLLTALPMEVVASLALSSRVGLVLMAKERVMWDTNSTEMPTACGQKRGFSHEGVGCSPPGPAGSTRPRREQHVPRS